MAHAPPQQGLYKRMGLWYKYTQKTTLIVYGEGLDI